MVPWSTSVVRTYAVNKKYKSPPLHGEERLEKALGTLSACAGET